MPDPNTGQTACPTIEDQLGAVNDKIVEYTSQKLPELKAELEQVKKKKDDAKKEYEAKYKELKDLWCKQNDLLLRFRNELKGASPYSAWLDYIKNCICAKRAALNAYNLRLKCRGEIKGRYEAARDEAQSSHDAAKDAANAWLNAAKVIADQLNANGKIIDEICKLNCGPDRPVAVYKLWFKWLQSHAQMRPDTACFDVPIEEHPDNLCPPPDYKPCRDCDKYEPAPRSGPGGQPACPVPTPATPPGKPTEWVLGSPWLISVDKYAQKIDCAFQALFDAKVKLAAAQRCFGLNADDLASVRAERDAKAKTLDADIEECLKKKAPEGCCTTEDKKPKPAPDPCVTPDPNRPDPNKPDPHKQGA